MPDKPINVKLFKATGRPNYEVEWRDPATGKMVRRSTGTKIKRDAERFRDKLEDQLNDPRARQSPKLTWGEFRKLVDRDFLPDRRPATRERYTSAMNVFQRAVRPKLMSGVRAAEINQFKAACRAAGNSDATIASHLRHLKAVLRWAEKQNLIATAPQISIPSGEAKAKGRALDDAGFARLIEAVPVVVGDDRAQSWEHLIRGLWLSGLRISEALSLTWDDEKGVHVDLTRETPSLVIPGRLQKGRKDTVTPLVPDFAEFLHATPESDRRGFVFNPASARSSTRLVKRQVQDIFGKIAHEAKVSATLHDLRRSFCTRWARVLLPQHLKALARHASISTTLGYYANIDAAETADAIKAAVAIISADMTKKPRHS